HTQSRVQDVMCEIPIPGICFALPAGTAGIKGMEPCMSELGMAQPAGSEAIPSTLVRPGATQFWLAVLLTAAGTGIGAAALTRLLEVVQRLFWGGSGTDILAASQKN